MKLSDFISHLASNNDLKYHIYNDKSDSLPLSVRLVLNYNGSTHESWGVSPNHDLAFFKALMELIERVCMRHTCPFIFKSNFFSSAITINELVTKYRMPLNLLLPSNSNGMAVGVTRNMAKQSARNELIERHAILLSLLLRIRPERIKGDERKIAQLEGHDLRYYHLKVGSYHVILLLDLLPNGGVLTTHACSRDFKTAKFKAFEEIIPNILYFNNNLTQKIEINTVEKDNILSFIRYWKFSGDQRLIKFLEDKLINNSSRTIPSIQKIYYGECSVPQIFQKLEFPIFCYRAISPDAQQLFIDNWKAEYINPRYMTEKFPEFPHCIS